MKLINLRKEKKEPNYFQNNLNKSKVIKKYDNKNNNDVKTSNSILIGDGVKIVGTISANDVEIKGSIEGDIDCKNISIDKSGNVKGKIITENIIVEGKFEGELNADVNLQIKNNGHVNGKITYGSIEIEDGGKLLGEIIYREKNNKQEEFKDWKAL